MFGGNMIPRVDPIEQTGLVVPSSVYQTVPSVQASILLWPEDRLTQMRYPLGLITTPTSIDEARYYEESLIAARCNAVGGVGSDIGLVTEFYHNPTTYSSSHGSTLPAPLSVYSEGQSQTVYGEQRVDYIYPDFVQPHVWHCQSDNFLQLTQGHTGMINVSVFRPEEPGKTFIYV